MISTRGNDETEAEDENTIKFGHGMISNYDLSDLQSYHFSKTSTMSHMETILALGWTIG